MVLNEAEIHARLQGLTGWIFVEGVISKAFSCGNFLGSVEFVNRITPLAEAADHHPDLDIRWNTVTVRLATHSQGGITEADFALAQQIEALS
jgi:4a-hydroxytetrahydrobiopterin dehydratase